MLLKHKRGYAFSIFFLTVNKYCAEYCVCIKSLTLFSAIVIYCCPKAIKNMSARHAVALGDMFFHHGQVSLFRNG